MKMKIKTSHQLQIKLTEIQTNRVTSCIVHFFILYYVELYIQVEYDPSYLASTAAGNTPSFPTAVAMVTHLKHRSVSL